MSAAAGGLRFHRSDLYMTDHSNKIEPVRSSAGTPRDELIVFLIIVALVWPLVTVGAVGGYGFAVWMYQAIAGPPGPPKR
ncbi:periplasmic nitrate reductase, NapE protein [Bradyrhizobium sp. ma5]|uniref:periplasmic nitrate reductase, NapE protein n=1 Tax=Bradyrhizobium sp. ma5 TaxID=3344828 RepID=UPI0035D447D6